MKVHQQFARALLDLHLNYHHSDHKLLRPLVPKPHPSSTVDPKSFIKPDKKDSSPQAVETTTLHLGGTRWNPTQEQIGILEMLYKGGMRTPNAHQIEQITTQLSNYGKIEGKNVFYWFQNHKARERQKQKRSSITLNFDTSTKSKEESVRFEQNSGKRKCRTWPSECLSQGEITHTITADDNPKISAKLNSESDEEEEDLGMKSRTLNLFPLHPEGRLMMGVSTD